MEKKMYTETLEKVRNDYAVRNIDKLERSKPVIWKKRWSCTN